MRSARVAPAAVAGLVLISLSLVLLAASHAAFKRPLLTIQARIRVYVTPGMRYTPDSAPRLVTFSPDVVNVGPVIIDIHNDDDDSHTLVIAGVSSRLIGPGGRANIHVTFRHPGIYSVGVTMDTVYPMGGSLTVVK